MNVQKHFLSSSILILLLCSLVLGADVGSDKKRSTFSRTATLQKPTIQSRPVTITAAGDTVYYFNNDWSYSTLGLDYDEDLQKFWYAHESQSSSHNPTIYLTDSSGTVYNSIALSDTNSSWPWQLDNRTGIDIMPNGNLLLPDYNGDLSYADDNIVEITTDGIILNAWEMDDEVGSNDCANDSTIDSIIDIAVISDDGHTIRAYATASYDGNCLYEIELYRTDNLWTPNSWTMVGIDTLPEIGVDTDGDGTVDDEMLDILGVDIRGGNVLISDWRTTLVAFYDSTLTLIDITRAYGRGGYNSGIAFMQEGNKELMAFTDFSSDQTGVAENIFYANYPPEISDIPDQSVYVNTVIGPVSFTIDDDNTDPDSLVVTATSDNQTLIPDANISLGGSGTDRTITITPTADGSGSAQITVTVTDEDNDTATDLFDVAINAVGSLIFVNSSTGVDDAGRDGSESQPFATISYAVGRATSGDSIDVTGTFTADGVANDGIVIDKNLTLRGQGEDQTFVQGHASDASSADRRCFTISSGTTVTLRHMTLRHGGANGGGAIKNVGDELVLENCIVTENASVESSPFYVGGGIYSTGSLSLNNCTVSDNSSLGKGGAIYAKSDLTLENTTVSGNSAGQAGGGICYYVDTSYPTMRMTNCTISGNSTTAANGGGINLESYQNMDVYLTNVTIANNSCDGTVAGEGIYGYSDDSINLDVVNCILDNGTTSNYDITGGGKYRLTRSYTLCRDASMPITGLGNLNTTDPLLEPLADNGGDTQTHALAGNSPAVDAGTFKGVPNQDQRGESRPQGLGYDMGAFERVPQTFFVNSTAGIDDATQDGSVLKPWATISYAIGRDEVGAGDVLNTTGTFSADGISGDGIVVDKSLTITGQVGLPTVVQAHAVSAASADRRCFTIAPDKRVILMNMIISNGNAGSNDGGGIYNNGELNLVNCTIAGNMAGNGGGIYSDNQLRLGQCTLNNNNSSSHGGAIFVYSSDPNVPEEGMGTLPTQNLSMLNCTISGNNAGTVSGNGGGVVLHAKSVSLPTKMAADLTNVTIANNNCNGSGAGMYQLAEAAGSDSALVKLRLKNSILSNGTSNNYGSLATGTSAALILERSYTLCRDISMSATGEGNLNNTDPLLGVLADNGGDTQTHSLLENSPAKNAGTADGINHVADQRGMPHAGVPDMGSYEIQKEGVKLVLNLLLEGPYDANGDSMKTLLHQNSLIPHTSPYSEDPVTLAQLPSANIVDWILVQLLPADGSQVLASQSAFLTQDGSVVTSSGLDTLVFDGLASDTYIIQVNHRNHLQVQSSSAVSLTPLIALSYDFTTATSAAGSHNLKELETDVWGLPAGDLYKDGQVTSQDYVDWYNKDQEGVIGYLSEDFQLNGTVENADYQLWWDNAWLGFLFEALN
jgi:predicted outer membrane repeat protein